MSTDRKALAERLRNGLMKHEDGVLVKVKGEAVCTVRDLRALLATALREEREPDRFEQMVEEDADKWDLWKMAFLSAMNTTATFRDFLRQVRDGTALDWWKKDFQEGLESGAIQPLGRPTVKEADDETR